MFKVPELRRVATGPYASTKEKGNNGFFRIPQSTMLSVVWYNVIAEDAGDWEHVSVTKLIKGIAATPSWDEMCMIKDLFWGGEDECYQFHPKKSDYVNLHDHVLHIWRPSPGSEELPKPPMNNRKKKEPKIVQQ